MVTGMFYLHFITQQITGQKTNIAGEKANYISTKNGLMDIKEFIIGSNLGLNKLLIGN
jgi:hypothetical protein